MATHTINRVAIYARVSTTNHGQDVTMQMRELRDYCERRGWTAAGEHVDVGISLRYERSAARARPPHDGCPQPQAPL